MRHLPGTSTMAVIPGPFSLIGTIPFVLERLPKDTSNVVAKVDDVVFIDREAILCRFHVAEWYGIRWMVQQEPEISELF